ncbi:MAG: Gfo/Idh/MocA family oxidoreductase [Anaerolineae bacterium]|nr:Gfo/Idh/MocA family oxidoreductase [Anaerolineae bacterium]
MATSNAKVKVGIIGCGNIAPAYIKGCQAFSVLDLVACADIEMERAELLAAQYDLKPYTVAGLLTDPDIQIVINLTIPRAHAEVSLAVIEAGKHVHSEKPLATTRADGKKVVEAAKQAGVRVGCAPDTFLGGGGQTCRKLIEDGWIGEPVAATAFMMGHGPESWHPNPDFYYQQGGGPLFDMGPYYLTALVNLLGPVKRVGATTRMSFLERIATSEMHYGRHIPVEVATHTTAVLDFASGPVGTAILSFDIWAHNLPRIEIYGSEGTLSVPDPNTFRGPASVWRTDEREWREMPMTHNVNVGRGIGVADMAYGLLSGRAHRASGDLAYHVLEIMESFDEASSAGKYVEIESRPAQPAPLPLGLLPGTLDE